MSRFAFGERPLIESIRRTGNPFSHIAEAEAMESARRIADGVEFGAGGEFRPEIQKQITNGILRTVQQVNQSVQGRN